MNLRAFREEAMRTDVEAGSVLANGSRQTADLIEPLN